MKQEEEHCHYSGLPSPMAYGKDDIDYDGMGNQGRVPEKKKQMNRNKEAVMLSKVILGITGLIAVAVYPPIVLVGIIGFAGWTLYKHYTV